MIIDVDKLKEEIGDKLREAREEKSMSQDEVAKMLGLSKVGYGALERGKNLISLNYLIALTYILQKPITYFIPGQYLTEEERQDALADPRLRFIVDLWGEKIGDVDFVTEGYKQALYELILFFQKERSDKLKRDGIL